MHRHSVSLAVVVVVLLLLTVALAAWQFLTIKSTGLPLGPAVRFPNAIAQIISTQERYLPSLHRNPDKDRFRLDLLVVSLADPAQQKTITLTRQQGRNALQPMTKILGADGDLIWVQALELVAVNLKTKRVVRFSGLQQANPELRLFLDTARFEFTDRLVAVSPDWQQAYAFAADTLRATSCAPPQRSGSGWSSSADTAEAALCSGGLLSTTDWFGALAPREAAGNFKSGFSLPREFPLNPKDEPRQLHHARIATNEVRPRIVTLERISDVAYRGAALLRSVPGGELLRVGDPDAVLMLHRAGIELTAPWTLSRVGPDGKVHWASNTGIGMLKQVLPGTDLVILIGERPPVPGKVPEPVLVFVDVGRGATNTVSLWR